VVAAPPLNHAGYALSGESGPATIRATMSVIGGEPVNGPSDAPEPRLLDRVRGAVRTRHFSRRTEAAYVA
jgi:hypothetical protein